MARSYSDILRNSFAIRTPEQFITNLKQARNMLKAEGPDLTNKQLDDLIDQWDKWLDNQLSYAEATTDDPTRQAMAAEAIEGHTTLSDVLAEIRALQVTGDLIGRNP